MSSLVRLLLWMLLVLPVGARAVEIVTQQVQPSKTGSGIGLELLPRNHHHVAQPAQTIGRKDVLVVFLGGSGSSPGAYTEITQDSAAQGFGVINLRYPNGDIVGTTCENDDACFSALRGETIYGQGVVYPGTAAGHDTREANVSRQNSIVNRLVGLLQHLRAQPADPKRNPDPAYWGQFLVAAPGSPYVAGGVALLPDWSKIVVAGHSQGAGHAAFLGVTLPVPMRRVVMFSAPNDHVGRNSASWIFRRGATPPARFWGLRSADEGAWGEFIPLNWQNLEVGGSGTAAVERNVGTGQGTASPSQRLVLAAAGSLALTNHNSTVADGRYDAIHAALAEDRKTAWRYLLSGALAD